MATDTLDSEQQPKPKKPTGFAALPPERRREIASMGGKASLNRHKWTSQEASTWGKIGGTNAHRRKAS